MTSCCKTRSSAAARAKRVGHPAQGPDLQKGGETAWCMLLTAVVRRGAGAEELGCLSKSSSTGQLGPVA
jgi:hypothetical protein